MLFVPVAIACGIGLFASVKILKHRHHRGLTVKLTVSSNNNSSDNDYIPIGLKDPFDQGEAKNISLIINGVNYLFSLPDPTQQLSENNRDGDDESLRNASLTVHDLAIEFCQLRGSDLGFTLKTFSRCVNPSKSFFFKLYLFFFIISLLK